MEAAMDVLYPLVTNRIDAIIIHIIIIHIIL